MKKLAVKDMPEDMANACYERGYGPDHRMTFDQGLKEWFAWEIGDGTWADIVLAMQYDFKATVKELKGRTMQNVEIVGEDE